LRDLQSEEALGALLGRLAAERDRLVQALGKPLPLAVKIAPDLDADAIRGIARVLVASGVDAAIATNTTIAREAVAALPHGNEAGGLSGAPVREPSNVALARLVKALDGALPVIGVGGILSGEDARAKIALGAALVQVYTGLIYRGPGLVAECVRALAAGK